MKKILYPLTLLFSFTVFVLNAQENKVDLSQLEIKYEKFVLDNGLTLLVHEDHKAPIAAVNVWYHVGAKNEVFGKTGFAHLFEHLMFNGSENFNDDYFQAIERIGGTDVNGTTNSDRTNYFQNVPLSALDATLWLESDRMGHFAGAISQELLDEQRAVVKNEKRQGENQPYGRVFNQFAKACYPANHPYHRTVIGLMEDLNAASVEDVQNWFKEYYGPSNAVLTIAGDVNPQEVLEKVKKYFGDIPPGPPVTAQKVYRSKRTEDTRDVMQDRVPQSRIYQVWNVTEFGNPDAFLLDHVSNILSQGKNSRLYKRLVYDDQIATSVNSFNWEREIAGIFVIQADVKPGVSNEVVEKAINEEVERFLKEGPTEAELQRVTTQYFADFIRGIERIGGFGGKSDILASNMTYTENPGFYKVRLKAMQDATATDVKAAANRWLSSGKYTLEVNPFPEYGEIASDVDRTKGMPELGKAETVVFPKIQRATLSNGLKIIVAERNEVPMVELRMIFDAGYSSDQFGKPGTASLAMNMMDEGTQNRTSLQINEELALLGAQLNTGSNLDESVVSMSALTPNIDKSLELFSDVILNPSFPEADFERLKKEQMVRIQQEKASPVQMALRVFPKFMYGEGHAYALPLTGSGYEQTVNEIAREDLIKFYDTWFKPNNATLTVVGNISLEDATSKLEKLFKKWKDGDIPKKNISTVEPASKKIYLMDRPGSLQSVIIAGHVTTPGGSEDDLAIRMMNNILGGEFTARVNMNLREDKGWAYGAFTLLVGAKGQRPFIAYAPVQSDKTSESMAELNKEVRGFMEEKPATEEEFRKTQKNEILSLPGSWETLNAVEASIGNAVRYGYSDTYYQDYADNIRNLTLDDIQEASQNTLKPDAFSWIVVGDRTQIEQKIKDLGYAEVVIIDGDGNIIEPSSQKLNTEND